MKIQKQYFLFKLTLGIAIIMQGIFALAEVTVSDWGNESAQTSFEAGYFKIPHKYGELVYRHSDGEEELVIDRLPTIPKPDNVCVYSYNEISRTPVGSRLIRTLGPAWCHDPAFREYGDECVCRYSDKVFRGIQQ